VITDAKKSAFTGADVFTELGYSFSRALYGDVSFLPSAANIYSSSASHVPGTLVNKDGTIYLIGPIADSPALFGIPSMAIFNSWGYSMSNVLTANSYDRNLPTGPVISARTPGELSPFEVIQTPPTVQISSLIPSSGQLGTMVTITGSGFSATENYVDVIIKNSFYSTSARAQISSDNKTLSFTMPSSLTAPCIDQPPPGSGVTVTPQDPNLDIYWRGYCSSKNIRTGDTLSVVLSNSSGSSNSQIFTVTGTATPPVN
jgi:IPT/TIG domain